MKSQRLSNVRGRSLRSGLLLCDDPFQARDVFQEALAGQDEEIIAELRILKVDFKAVFYALDRRGSSLIGRKEAKFSHEAPWRKLDADFLDQKPSGGGEEHFGSRITLLEQPVAPDLGDWTTQQC
jgi:hypothetical protein